MSKRSSDSFPHTKDMSPCMETLRTTLWWFLVLQFFGKFWKARKIMGQICPTVFSILWLYPRNWRPMMHCNVVLTVFHAWWYIFCVWKIVRTTFWRIAVSQLLGDCSIMWENFIYPGSDSATWTWQLFYIVAPTNIYLSYALKCGPNKAVNTWKFYSKFSGFRLQQSCFTFSCLN